MPFGKFYPAKTERVKTILGEVVTFNTPAGYGGLFWGSVYDSDGNAISNAQDYFLELGKAHNRYHDYEYWDVIVDFIDEHCLKYVNPYCGDKHHYQSGFGGDEADGVIDFWVEEQLPEMPKMPFEIAGKSYIMKWYYSTGDPRDDTSVSSG